MNSFVQKNNSHQPLFFIMSALNTSFQHRLSDLNPVLNPWGLSFHRESFWCSTWYLPRFKVLNTDTSVQPKKSTLRLHLYAGVHTRCRRWTLTPTLTPTPTTLVFNTKNRRWTPWHWICDLTQCGLIWKKEFSKIVFVFFRRSWYYYIITNWF